MSNGHLPRDAAGAAGQWALNEEALHVEILFWRELIESSGPGQPRESVERMRQALALAERKLQEKVCAANDRKVVYSEGKADEEA